MRDESLPPRRSEPFSRVLPDNDGLWVVINGFLHQVKDRQYLRENPGLEPASDTAVAALRSGPSGRLWFGGLSGRLNTSSNGVLTRVPQPAKPSADTILDVCETRNGDLWLGMASTGLRRWRNGEVLSLTVQEGLGDNCIPGRPPIRPIPSLLSRARGHPAWFQLVRFARRALRTTQSPPQSRTAPPTSVIRSGMPKV
ncbi:MAG: hypothetical protein NT154_28520 [Verrucomicrobia bacterium]|nr:hypothetical protein [Verrucomicrobiota bacterium]